jgi:hypothetical protein
LTERQRDARDGTLAAARSLNDVVQESRSFGYSNSGWGFWAACG